MNLVLNSLNYQTSFWICSKVTTHLRKQPPLKLGSIVISNNTSRLQIKSKGPLGSETQSFAVLCSDEKTYQLRQQQTSNSLFIVKPRSTTLEDGTPAEGISVIASCGATLELTLSKDSAEPYLRELLRYWDGENMNEMEIDNRSKENIYDDIPLSTSEIEQGWETLCAFEHSNVCYIPTNTYLFTAWKSIISAAFADNIDTADHTQDATLWRAVSDEGIPEELFLVILSHSKKTNGSIWIARLLLESLSNQVISREEFMISLKDVLPRNMGFPDTFDAFKVCIKLIS